MKPLELHPLSALAGAAALGLTLVAAGAAQEVAVDRLTERENLWQATNRR